MCLITAYISNYYNAKCYQSEILIVPHGTFRQESFSPEEKKYLPVHCCLTGRLSYCCVIKKFRVECSCRLSTNYQKKRDNLATIPFQLKSLEVYINMNNYIPTILVHMIADCNTYSHFIHRLIHTEKTSKYLF